MIAAGIDLGGSAVKAWVVDDEVGLIGMSRAVAPITRPAPERVEADPKALWQAVCTALTEALAHAGPKSRDLAGVTVSSLRQGFVLIDGREEIGPAILNSDRRGASHVDLVDSRIGPRVLYEVTGHWSAPELTLPKLLHIADVEPDRWAHTRSVLFLHDWVIWRLCGVLCSEISYVCAGQMADVAKRTWATSILEQLGVGTSKLCPIVEPGAIVGRVTRRAAGMIPGLRDGLPVVSGGADTQVAAMGLGGLSPNVVTIIAGSSTPVQAATRTPARDPEQRPWVSTHLEPDLWAVETNAGYPGTLEGWLRQLLPENPPAACDRPAGTVGANGVTAVTSAPHWNKTAWNNKPPYAMVGFTPTTTATDLVRAGVESHVFGVRANVEDLTAALGRPVERVLVGGGAAQGISGILADALGRVVEVSDEPMPAALAGAALVARALGRDSPLRMGQGLRLIYPCEDVSYEEPYQRYLAVSEALQSRNGRS